VSIAERFNIPSISYTYNEPAIFFEFAYDIMKLAYERGIKNIFVSSGYETEEVLERSVPFLSAMNIDLKSFSDDFYQKICGARLKPVLKAIEKAYKLGIYG
jgi:pyruvate formate lyase activating enzyme